MTKRTEHKDKLIVVLVPFSTERYLSWWLSADIGVESDNLEGLFAMAG